MWYTYFTVLEGSDDGPVVNNQGLKKTLYNFIPKPPHTGRDSAMRRDFLVFKSRQTYILELCDVPLLLPFPGLGGFIFMGVVGTLVTGDPLPMLFTVGAAELPFEFFLGEVC